MQLLFLARLTDHKETWTYKWKRIMVGALGCMNNMDFEKKKFNYKIVLDVFIICQKLRYIQVIEKITYS